MRGILAVFRKTFYTKKVEKEPVIIIKGGKPVAALVSIINADIETVSLSNNPKFIALTRINLFLKGSGKGVKCVEKISLEYGNKIRILSPVNFEDERGKYDRS